MKKGYKKLFIFELIILLILFLNSFVWNILTGYKMPIFIFLILVVFKLFFGLEKDKNRYIKDIIFEIIIFLMIFFIAYYLLGILIGFAKVDNYYSLYGIKTFIMPIILLILLKELLRYNMLKKSEGSKVLTIITFILFVCIDALVVIPTSDLSTRYNLFIFLSLTLLPAISNNFLLTYQSIKVGYKPNIIYLLVMNLYRYLIPIIPNPD